MKQVLTILLLAGAVAACSPQDEEARPTEAPLALGVDVDNMDTTVEPQDDFYQYVNGGWLAANEIPADRSRWGSFDELREQAEQDVLAIVRDAASVEGAAGSDEQKIGDLFRSFMDVESIDAKGVAPMEAALAQIDALADHAAIVGYWGTTQSMGGSAPVGLYVSQDARQSDQYITSLTQSGLGLPDRDYYLKDDERSIALRETYKAHIAQMFELAGLDDGADAAQRVLDIETRLAEVQWTRVQNRDRNATYNKMTPAELAESAGGVDWPAFLGTARVDGVDALVVRQPNYFAALGGILADFPVAAWQDYHRFHLLRWAAPYLTTAFVDANFDFYGRELSGQPENRSREKRAVATVEDVLGFMVGELYVAKHFQPEAKARMDALVANLKVAFADAIDQLAWMSDATKAEAQKKLARFNTKIGYPEVWRDYDCVEIDATDLVGNLQRSIGCEYERMIGRLGGPVDRGEWFLTPQTVNAYYSSTMNEIVFPAAILQPPFFNVEADDAVNYGAIGGVIGHEITHGFDDQGRRSDGEGNLRDWWSAEDATQFEARAQRMIDQYDQIEALPDTRIQGALTLGENIADLGGLTVAFRAYQHSLGDEPAPVIDGLTGPQRFFLGWAQIWRSKVRDEELMRRILTDPHSPGRYRVLGVLSNMPEFYEAFEVQPDDPMYRGEEVRVKIW